MKLEESFALSMFLNGSTLSRTNSHLSFPMRAFYAISPSHLSSVPPTELNQLLLEPGIFGMHLNNKLCRNRNAVDQSWRLKQRIPAHLSTLNTVILIMWYISPLASLRYVLCTFGLYLEGRGIDFWIFFVVLFHIVLFFVKRYGKKLILLYPHAFIHSIYSHIPGMSIINFLFNQDGTFQEKHIGHAAYSCVLIWFYVW